MQDILETLKKAENEKVKLYFLERKINRKQNDITYLVMGTRILEKLQEGLLNIVKKQLKEKISSKSEIISYGTIPFYDRPHIETVHTEDVPYFKEIIDQFPIAQKNILVDDKLKKIYGFIIRIDVGNQVVLFFKKYTYKKFISKGKIAIVFGLNGLDYIDENVVTLEKEFDAVTMIAGEKVIGKETIFLFNRSKFESLFSFVDFYQKEIEGEKQAIVKFGVIGNVDDFMDYCKGNMINVKKLTRILHNEEVKKMTKEKVKKTVEDYYLDDIGFDSDGNMIASPENINTMLHILDDDYVNSEATNTKYEAHSKVKRS